MKKTLFVLIITIFTFDLIASETKPSVIAGTFSIYDTIKHIAANSVELEPVMPFGVDAHSYEPTPRDMAKIHDSSLVVYSGAGLQRWMQNIELRHNSLDVSKHVKLRELKEDSGHDHHHEHDNSDVDPHHWLDIDNMISSALAIKDELSKLLPRNKALYEKNTVLYIEMLKSLDSDYKKQLQSCKKDTIFVNHNAYSYLLERYGFKVESLSGVSPEAETSAKNMIHLIKHIKEDGITTIFYENLASDKTIRSVARETGVDVDILHPIGNITADEVKRSLSYEDIMRDNLRRISKALECR